jgi:hypothetical protein
MKIFVSYSRRDAGDFAYQIYEHLKEDYDIFTDVNDIQIGDVWSNTIEANISNCDLFIIILTNAALKSQEVEREVLQAQRENKKIIPCIHRDIEKDDIKWDLSSRQGVEFVDKHELARNLYTRISKIQNKKNHKGKNGNLLPEIKGVSPEQGILKSKSDAKSDYEEKSRKANPELKDLEENSVCEKEIELSGLEEPCFLKNNAIPNPKKAIIIGVSEYNDNDIQNLEFCANDGEKMHETLTSIDYQIQDNYKMIGNVKFDQMRDAIYDFFDNRNIKADDILVFYYSGHGIPDTDGDVYLSTSEIDPDSPYRRGFSFNELTKMMNNSASTKIVTILDCCYSGAIKIGKETGKGEDDAAIKLGTAAINDKSSNLRKNKGICLLAASQAAQEAYALKEGDNSIFTHYLLEGLKGNEKSIDPMGNVTADSLGKFIYREIVNLPHDRRPKQTPIQKIEASDGIILAQYPELIKKPTEPERKPPLEKSCMFLTPIGRDNGELRRHSDQVFHEIIKPATMECGYEVIYDANSEPGEIINQLVDHLYNDEFVIADLSGNDAHVMYGVGLSHAFRKHAVLIKDTSMDSVRLDLPGISTIDFDLKVNGMVEKCKKEIVRQIKSIESRFLSLPLNLSPDVEMVSGEKEVLDLLNKHKRQTKEEYCAMWITDEYDRETLNKYYLEENKLEINNITRLIDIKKIEKERIREHIMMFKDDICSGRYSLFSTLNGDYEIALCQKNRKKNDVTAILMFPDNLNNKVDLAIYSNAPSFVDAIRIRFRDFQQKGKRFRIIKNDIDKSIDDWILQTERGYGNG